MRNYFKKIYPDIETNKILILDSYELKYWEFNNDYFSIFPSKGDIIDLSKLENNIDLEYEPIYRIIEIIFNFKAEKNLIGHTTNILVSNISTNYEPYLKDFIKFFDIKKYTKINFEGV